MSGDLEIERAKEEARTARAQLVATMGRIQGRFSPQTLVHDVWREVRERGTEIADDAVDIARAKPVATGAIVAGVLVFAARQPLWRTISRLFSKPSETREGDGKLIRQNLSDVAPAHRRLDAKLDQGDA